MIIIVEEGRAYMHHAEKKMQKNKMLSHPLLAGGFNLDTPCPGIILAASVSQKEDENPWKLKKAARRCNIPNPLSLSIQEIKLHLQACKRECASYQEHGKRFRRQHLKNRKRIALEQEDEEAFRKISAIIQREQQQNFWCKLNYVTGK